MSDDLNDYDTLIFRDIPITDHKILKTLFIPIICCVLITKALVAFSFVEVPFDAIIVAM